MKRDFDLVLARLPDAYVVQPRDRRAYNAPWLYLQSWVDVVEDAHGSNPRLREAVNTFCEARALVELAAHGLDCETVLGETVTVSIDGRGFDSFLDAARRLLPHNPIHG